MITRKINQILLTLVALFIVFPTSISAQTVYEAYEDVYEKRPSLGVKVGVNFSNLYVDEVSDEKVRIGFNAGVYGNFPVGSDVFSIQPELLYTTRGSRTVYDNLVLGRGNVDFNLDYLELPVLAMFNLGDYFNIHVGAYAAYLLNANISSDGDLGEHTVNLDEDEFNRFDFGPVIGIGFKTGMFGGGFGGGVRYNYGMQKIAETTSSQLLLGDSKNSALQIYLSLGF